MVGTASADYALRLGEPGEHDDPLVDERDALETRVDRCSIREAAAAIRPTSAITIPPTR